MLKYHKLYDFPEIIDPHPVKGGFYLVKTSELNSEVSIQFFGDVVREAMEDVVLPPYDNLECVVSSLKDAKILEEYGATIHKITDNYYICYKDLRC